MKKNINLLFIKFQDYKNELENIEPPKKIKLQTKQLDESAELAVESPKTTNTNIKDEIFEQSKQVRSDPMRQACITIPDVRKPLRSCRKSKTRDNKENLLPKINSNFKSRVTETKKVIQGDLNNLNNSILFSHWI